VILGLKRSSGPLAQTLKPDFISSTRYAKFNVKVKSISVHLNRCSNAGVSISNTNPNEVSMCAVLCEGYTNHKI